MIAHHASQLSFELNSRGEKLTATSPSAEQIIAKLNSFGYKTAHDNAWYFPIKVTTLQGEVLAGIRFSRGEWISNTVLDGRLKELGIDKAELENHILIALLTQ